MDPTRTVRTLPEIVQSPAERARLIPPHNDEAEMALLGAIMHNNRAFERVRGFLKAEHFANRVHGRVFEAIDVLIGRVMIADPITLKQYFEHDDDLAEVGGFKYLMRLAGSVASIVNAEDYGRTIHDLYLRRRLIAHAEAVLADAYAEDPEDEATDKVKRAEARLMDLALAETEARGAMLEDAAHQAVERLAKADRTRGAVVGVTTGLIDVDRVLGGLHAPDLIVLGGRPAMGKTDFCVTVCLAAARGGVPVVLFSLEMSDTQVGQRGLAAQGAISVDRQRRHDFDDVDLGQLRIAAEELRGLPLFIDDTPANTVAAMRARLRQIRRSMGLGLVAVDYIQLMGSGLKRADNRVHEITAITTGLKTLAKEFEVPVLALSQLSRALEARDDKRPRLADLRESGSIEQDADVVMFAYRDEYYLAQQEPKFSTGESRDKFAARYADWQAEIDKARGVAEILVDKNRHGPTQRIACRYDGARSAWSNLARRQAA